jgi:hypothetical protein
MKKLIFANDEEKKIIRHLHESVKRRYLNLNEQVGFDAETHNYGMIGKDALGNDLFYKGPTGWNRDGDGPLGYWKLLFYELQTNGIAVKWENSNADDSTLMYWNGWIIYKDLTTNGGYPILFKDSATNVSAKFKFLGGKYAGQPADKIILDSESINLTFNLGLFGKYDNKKMSESIIKYQKSHPREGFEPSLSEPKLVKKSDPKLVKKSDPKLVQTKVKRPPNPSVIELQKNLNAKFSSGLVPDGYLGRKTRKAIYDALTKGTQQTTTALEPVKDETLTPGEVGTQI